jgi:hypothetical protein
MEDCNMQNESNIEDIQNLEFKLNEKEMAGVDPGQTERKVEEDGESPSDSIYILDKEKLDKYHETLEKRKDQDKKRLDQIPLQLRNEKFRFCKVRKNGKTPFEKGWNTDPDKMYKFDDPRLIEHCEKNSGNYGVLGGHGGMIILDWDDSKTYQELGNILPDTLKTQSPRENGAPHCYYFIQGEDKPVGLRIKKDTGRKDERGNPIYETIADIQGLGTQVVGPGSIYPKEFYSKGVDGIPYRVINDVPIATIIREQLLKVFDGFTIQKDNQERKPYELKDKDNDDPWEKIKAKISISDLLIEQGIYTGKNPCECPLHTSKNGHCFSFDEGQGVFHCFHCQKKGDIFHLYALIKGYDFMEDEGKAWKKKALKELAEKAEVELNQGKGEKTKNKEEKKDCPFCHYTLSAKVIYCRNCHKWLDDDAMKEDWDIEFPFNGKTFQEIEIEFDRYWIYPLIARGGFVTLISGHKGCGKSMYILSLLSAAANKADLLCYSTSVSGCGGPPPKILYIDGEQTKEDLIKRFKFLNMPDNVIPFVCRDKLFTSRMDMPSNLLMNEKWRKVWSYRIEQEKFDIVVLDNITSLTPGRDENSTKDWSPVNQWLLNLSRGNDCHIIAIHHLGKDAKKGARGTSHLYDNPQNQFIMENLREDGDPFIKFKFMKVHFRNFISNPKEYKRLLSSKIITLIKNEETGKYGWEISGNSEMVELGKRVLKEIEKYPDTDNTFIAKEVFGINVNVSKKFNPLLDWLCDEGYLEVKKKDGNKINDSFLTKKEWQDKYSGEWKWKGSKKRLTEKGKNLIEENEKNDE